MLNFSTHTRLGDTPSSEDLNGVLSGLLSRSRRVGLQQCDLTGELASLLFIRLRRRA
jgi:hypothetical protein